METDFLSELNSLLTKYAKDNEESETSAKSKLMQDAYTHLLLNAVVFEDTILSNVVCAKMAKVKIAPIFDLFASHKKYVGQLYTEPCMFIVTHLRQSFGKSTEKEMCLFITSNDKAFLVKYEIIDNRQLFKIELSGKIILSYTYDESGNEKTMIECKCDLRYIIEINDIYGSLLGFFRLINAGNEDK